MWQACLYKSKEPVCRCSSSELMAPWCKARLGSVSHPSTTVSHVAVSTLRRSGLSSLWCPAGSSGAASTGTNVTLSTVSKRAQSLLTATLANY